MSEHSLDTWVWCGHCSACAWGVPPHGEGNPCPLTLRKAEQDLRLQEEVAEADIAKLRAETAYWEHAVKSGPTNIMDIIKKNLS